MTAPGAARLAASALAIAAVLAAAAAAAHQGLHRRTLRLLLEADALHASVQIVLPAGAEAYRDRRRWDGNADGRIDRGELDAALAELGERLRAELELRLDGRRLDSRPAGRSSSGLLGPTRREQAVSASFRLTLPLAPGPGAHRLRIRDRRSDGRHTPVQLQAAAGIALLGPEGAPAPSPLRGVLGAGSALLVRFAVEPPPGGRAPVSRDGGSGAAENAGCRP